MQLESTPHNTERGRSMLCDNTHRVPCLAGRRVRIFLHNLDPVSERLVEKDYTMIHILGNPFEATIAATALVLGGVMDQFSKLDVFLPHGGGFFAFATARIDWAMGTAAYSPRGRTETFKNLKLPRATYR
jgi:hypothetical protein